MKTLVLALSCLIFVACGENANCNVYVSGLCFVDDFDIDRDEVREVVNTLIYWLGEYDIDARDFPLKMYNQHVVVNVIDSPLSRDCKLVDRGVYQCRSHIGGIIYLPEEIYIRYYPCLGRTALAHELLHLIEWWYMDLDFEDYALHETPNFFNSEFGHDSIEFKVQMDLICRLNSCAELQAIRKHQCD